MGTKKGGKTTKQPISNTPVPIWPELHERWVQEDLKDSFNRQAKIAALTIANAPVTGRQSSGIILDDMYDYPKSSHLLVENHALQSRDAMFPHSWSRVVGWRQLSPTGSETLSLSVTVLPQ